MREQRVARAERGLREQRVESHWGVSRLTCWMLWLSDPEFSPRSRVLSKFSRSFALTQYLSHPSLTPQVTRQFFFGQLDLQSKKLSRRIGGFSSPLAIMVRAYKSQSSRNVPCADYRPCADYLESQQMSKSGRHDGACLLLLSAVS